MKRRMERPGFSRLSSADAYEMLNITRGGEPTLAAVLNFSIYPQAFFPQLCITAVVVPGSEIGCVDENAARFLDNKRISDVTIDDLDIGQNDYISIVISVDADAQNAGGLNLFGEHFGDHPQALVLRLGYHMKDTP